jgi:CBS domain-containing protein
MTVGEFCSRQVVFARRDEHVTEAARRMRDLHVGTLVVVDEHDGRRIPVGVVTDRDLVVRVLSEGVRDADALAVDKVMTTEPVTAREDDNLWDVVKKMRAFGIRRLPVVNDMGGLEGILSFDDLIDSVAEELSDLSSLMSREQKREREAKPPAVHVGFMTAKRFPG